MTTTAAARRGPHGASSQPRTRPETDRAGVFACAQLVVAAVKQQAKAGEALTAELSRLSAANAALAAELAAARATAGPPSQLESDYKTLCVVVAALNKKCAELESREAVAKAPGPGVVELRADNDRLRAVVEAANAQLAAAKSELKAEAAAAEEKAEALRVKLAASEAQQQTHLEQFRAAVNNLKHRVASQSQQQLATASGGSGGTTAAGAAGGGAVDKQRLVAFFERTFACTGDTDVLRRALGEFCDEEAARMAPTPGAVAPRSRTPFVPKPLLLVHRISAADVGLSTTPAPTASPTCQKRSWEASAEPTRVGADGDARASRTPPSTEPSVIDLTQEAAASETGPSAASSAPATEPKDRKDGSGSNNSTSSASGDQLGPSTPARTTPKRAHSAVSASEAQSADARRASQSTVGARPSSASSQPAKRRSTATRDAAPPSTASSRSAKRRSMPARDTAAPSASPASSSSGGSITEADVRRLYASKPWEAMFARRPLFSHVVNHKALSPNARNWVNRVLAFRFHFCQELWEQRHWLVVPLGAHTTDLDQMMEERARRHVRAQSAWNHLRATADVLVTTGQLSGDVWLDPFLWLPPTSPLTWSPTSCDLAAELGAIDAAQPERCFYVHDLACHPFYTSRLSDKHRDKYSLQ